MDDVNDEAGTTSDRESDVHAMLEFHLMTSILMANGDLPFALTAARELDENGDVPGKPPDPKDPMRPGWYLLKAISDGWHANGCPRLVLSASVASLLVSTKAPEVTHETLKAPYGVMLLEVPGEWTSLYGVGPLYILLARLDLADSTPTTAIVAARRFERREPGDPLDFDADSRKEAGIDSPDACARAITGDDALDESRASRLDLVFRRNTPAYFTEAVRYLVNTCCLVTAHRECAPQRTGKRAPPGKVVHDVRPPLDVSVTAEFRRHAMNLVANRRIAERKEALLHIVRGHWKRQPKGPGRSERELIWIRPYQRGAESLGRIVEKVTRITDRSIDEP